MYTHILTLIIMMNGHLQVMSFPYETMSDCKNALAEVYTHPHKVLVVASCTRPAQPV